MAILLHRESRSMVSEVALKGLDIYALAQTQNCIAVTKVSTSAASSKHELSIPALICCQHHSKRLRCTDHTISSILPAFRTCTMQFFPPASCASAAFSLFSSAWFSPSATNTDVLQSSPNVGIVCSDTPAVSFALP